MIVRFVVATALFAISGVVAGGAVQLFVLALEILREK